MRKIVLLLGICPFALLAALSSPKRPEKAAAIHIESKPISWFEPGDPSRSRFGALEFRGGLVLKSSSKHFGGISAMRIQQDGAHFIAATDQGFWLQGRLIYDGNRPAGIEGAAMAPILNSRGDFPGRLDVESVAQDGGTLYLGVERENSILRFNFGKKGFLARAEPVAIPRGIKDLPYNQGLEGMVFVPKKLPLGGTLIALSERGLDQAGNLKAFLVGGPSPGFFTVKRTEEFDISDGALLPDGDLLLLERKFSPLQGVDIRIRRIHMVEIKPGALVDGPILLLADSHCEVDNMEALSVHRDGSGEILLTMLSDDNFSALQRTLLLQFALKDKQIDDQIPR